MSCESESVMRLLRRSFSWEYYGGSHFQSVRHLETKWRLLPFLVVVCPTEGVYYSRIDGVGRLLVRAGEALIVPGGWKHTVAMPDGGILHHAHIQYRLFGAADVLGYFKVPFLVKGEKAAAIAAATRDLHIAMTAPSEPGHFLGRSVEQMSLGARLLELLVEISEPRDNDTGQFDEILRIEPALRYMETHLSGQMRRRDLAKLSSFSGTRFHFVFKHAVGTAPMSYLRNLRMNRAQLLLFRSGFSIAEVGEQVGYPDVFHFSKIFKNTFSVTPSAYRREMRARVLESQPRNSG